MVSQNFYEYFQREMAYLRNEGATFAKNYPKIARRLDINNVESADPHVERMLQSFAFLTARLQRDVEDLFPQISTALLEALYPQFLAPLPSYVIAQFKLNDVKGKLTQRHHVGKGLPLYAMADDQEICYFQSGAATDLYPLEIISCNLISTDDVPANLGPFKNHRLLKIVIRSTASTLGTLDLQRLRFYINADAIHQNKFYEALFLEENSVAYSYKNAAKELELVSARPGRLHAVGFEAEEALLPYPDHAHPGFRLLQEYFAYPQKYMFFDVDVHPLACDKIQGTIYIEVSDEVALEAKDVSAQLFQIGCVPIINLFNKVSEPIRVDHRSVDYRLIGDQRRDDTVEIHTVKDVVGAIPGHTEDVTFAPYFSYTHREFAMGKNQFWTTRRVYSSDVRKPGNDHLLSFVDYDFKPIMPAVDTIYANVLCFNRDLPLSMAAGTTLYCDQSLPTPTIYTVDRPSPPRYINRETTSQWQLITQLSLGHLGLGDPETARETLREVLRLYGNLQDGRTVTEADIIHDVTIKKTIRRSGQEAWRGFAHGTHFTITLEAGSSHDTSEFLLVSVLDRVLAQFASINSFTQLAVRKLHEKRIWKEWQPRSGNKNLL